MEPGGKVPQPSPGAIMVTHMRALCTELWNLRSEGAFCDIVLNIQGELVSAHSVILSACSPHLKKLCMDRSSITDTGAVSIHINDYSYNVCLRTLEFLYTGEREKFKESELEKEFENLAREWELFSSARYEGEKDTCLMGTSDEMAVTDQVKKVEQMEKEKRNMRKRLSKIRRKPPSRKKSVLGNEQEHTIRGGIEEEEKVKIEIQEEEDEEGEGEVPVGKLRLRSSKRKEVKDYQELSGSEEDFAGDNLSDSTTEEEEKFVKTSKSQPRRGRDPGQRIDKKKRTVKKLKSAASADAKGGKRGRRNRCYRCNIQFENREEYLAHGKEVHPRSLLRKQGLTCKVCNAQFYHYNLLQIHRLENHWEEGMKPARIYMCDFENCSYNTSRYAAFNLHRKGHTAETCVCDICGKLMKNRYSLKSHVEIIHERKQEKHCEKCDKTFSTRQAFKNHNINMHLGKRVRLFCTQCEYSCNRSETLKEHMLSSHNEQLTSNVFTCCICDYKTTEKRKLAQHARTHNLGERLHCEECGKSYTSRTSLNHHKRIHNNTAKIYKCNYCDYKTVYGVGSLRQHVRCMHKDKEMKPWKCEECTYEAMTEDILNHHKVITHGHPLPDKPPEPQPKSTTDFIPYKKSRSRSTLQVQNYLPQQQQQQQQQHIQQQQEPTVSQAPEKDPSSAELVPNLQTLNPPPHPIEMRSLPTNHLTQPESGSTSDVKTLTSMPVISRTGTTSGFVDVPLNYSLFRSATANQNFPFDPAQTATPPQVLMGQTQMGQTPMPMPGNMNSVHGWGDFQNF